METESGWSIICLHFALIIGCLKSIGSYSYICVNSTDVKNSFVEVSEIHLYLLSFILLCTTTSFVVNNMQ